MLYSVIACYEYDEIEAHFQMHAMTDYTEGLVIGHNTVCSMSNIRLSYPHSLTHSQLSHKYKNTVELTSARTITFFIE